MVIIVACPILFFNIIVDPYGVFGTDLIKTQLNPNMRYVKTKYLIDHPDKFDSFIIGSSRVNFLNPAEIEDEKYFNLTSPGATPDQHYKDIQFLNKNGVHIKNLIIGLDFLSFNSIPEEPSTDLLFIDPPQKINTKISFFSSYIFWRPEIDFVKKTFASNSLNYSSLLKNGTFYFNGVDDQIKQNPAKHIGNINFEHSSSTYVRQDDYHQAMEIIDSIVQYAELHKMNLVFFIHPTHHITYINLDLDKYFKILKKLTKITHYYDFSGLNSVAIDNLNYYESSHYRKNIGNMIISKIFNQTNDYIPDDFGRFVTQYNVDEDILNHKLLLKDYFESTNLQLEYFCPIELSKLKRSSINANYAIKKINGVDVKNLDQPLFITTPWIKLDVSVLNPLIHDPESEIFIHIGKRFFKINQDEEIKTKDLAFRLEYSKSWNLHTLIATSLLEKGPLQISVVVLSSNKTDYYTSDSCVKTNMIVEQKISDYLHLIKLGQRTKLSVDFINKIQPDRFIETKNESFLHITGWATDKMQNSESGGVLVSIDSMTYLSQFNQKRGDVAKQFNNVALENAGWGIKIPLLNLSNGPHKLTFKVLNNERTGYYETNKEYVFYHYSGQKTEPLKGLFKSKESTRSSIDLVNRQSVAKTNKPIQIKESNITISGWAIDEPAQKTASAVIMEINGKMYKCQYGLSRPDVSKALKNSELTSCGWKIVIPTDVIGKGKHKLILKIVNNDKTQYFEINKEVLIEVI